MKVLFDLKLFKYQLRVKVSQLLGYPEYQYKWYVGAIAVRLHELTKKFNLDK